MRILSRQTAVVVVLGALAILIALARLHTYHEPLERDITSAAVIANEMLAGRALYADLWDHKPPAVHVTHALAIMLVGRGPGAIYLLNIAAAVVTLLGVFVAASAVGGTAAGLWGAAFWTLVSGDLWLQANQPNAEVFINASIVWAFALLVGGSERRHVLRVVAIGGLFALASLYKPVSAATAAVLALAHVIAPWPGCSRRRALGDALLIGGIGAAAWLGTAAYFAARAHFTDFYQAVFAYNRYYSTHFWGDNAHASQTVVSNLLNSFFPDRSFPVLSLLTTLAVFTLAGAIYDTIRAPRRQWLMLFGFGVGTHIAVALPGQWWPHYYQLWLPPIAIGAGWAAVASRASGAQWMPRWVSTTAASTTILLLLAQQIPLYRVPPEAWSQLKYGELFVAEQKLGRELGALLATNETFYEFGAETGLYFESRHSPPSGAFYAYPLLEGPEASSLTSRAIIDLEHRLPTMLVVDQTLLQLGWGRHPILEWAGSRYVQMAGNNHRAVFLLFVRRGSRLDVTKTR